MRSLHLISWKFITPVVPNPLFLQGANFRDLSGVIVGADNVAVRDPTIKPILLPSGHLLVSGPVASMDDYPSSCHANWDMALTPLHLRLCVCISKIFFRLFLS